MNSKTLNLMSKMFMILIVGWISTASVAHASVGANPNEYTSKIVMERFNTLKPYLYEASKISGMDMADIVAIGSIESTLRVDTRSKYSSASGVLQYVKGSWKQDRSLYHVELGLPSNANVFDPRANLLIGTTSLFKLKQFLIEKSHLTEETLRVGDLYMSHLVGSTGAVKIINSNSNKPLNQIISLAKGNWKMYHKPNGQVRTAREFRLHMDYLVQREKKFYIQEVRKFQVAQVLQPLITPSIAEQRVEEMVLAINNTMKIVGQLALNS